jgi:hypothetical protein
MLDLGRTSQFDRKLPTAVDPDEASTTHLGLFASFIIAISTPAERI